MIFTFGDYVVDVDVEKTKQIYSTLPLLTQGCNCDGCLNFEAAINFLPECIRTFFDNLGIDPQKITECCVNCKNEDKNLSYWGFCHLCGSLIQGKNAWVKTSKNHSYYNRDLTYQVNDNWFVSFQKECSLVEKEFKGPVLQMEFEATIPWVLDRENLY